MNATKKIIAAVLLSAASAASFAAPMVEINTTEGKIVVDLNSKTAPVTVDNFLKYANSGFYNGTIFHRVINNFMIQAAASRKIWTRRKPAPRSNSKTRTVLKTPSALSQWQEPMTRTPRQVSSSSI